MRPGVPARVGVVVGVTAVAEALALWYRAVAAPPLSAMALCGPDSHRWRCQAEVLLLSRPAWGVVGLLAGAWIVYALAQLPDGRSSSRLEPAIATVVLAGLVAGVLSVDPLFHDTQTLPRWQALLLYPLGVVIARLAILAAAKSTVRGRLLFALGLPFGCAALGYVYATAVWQPGPGTGRAIAAQAATWTTVGALVGLCFAWATLRATRAPAARSSNWEDAIAVVLTRVLLAWIVLYGSRSLAGPDGGTATPLILCVLGAGMLRLTIAGLFSQRGTLRPRLGPEVRRRLGQVWAVSLVVTAATAVAAVPVADAAAAQCARTPRLQRHEHAEHASLAASRGARGAVVTGVTR